MNAQLPITQPKAALVAGNRPMAIVPQSIEEVWRLSELMFKSGLAPKDMNTQEKCAVAILHGLEVGLSPMQAVQKIAIINGRPTIWGDAALGLVKASGLCEFIHENGNDQSATCIVKRVGDPESVERTFTADDAKQAGLLGKPGPWQQYRKRMLQMRARGFALRDVFADVLGGMYIHEELEGHDIRDVTPLEPPTPPEPPAIEALNPRADAEPITRPQPDAGEAIGRTGDLISPTGATLTDALGGTPDDAIPPGLRRAKKATAPDAAQKAAEPKFDADQWLKDLDGALSGCTTAAQVFEVQETVQKPAVGLVSGDHYYKGRKLVVAALTSVAEEG